MISAILIKEQLLAAAMCISTAGLFFLAIKMLIPGKGARIKKGARKNWFKKMDPIILLMMYQRHKKIILAGKTLLMVLFFYFVFKHPVFASILGICLAVGMDEFLISMGKRNNHRLHLQAINFISHMILMLKAGRSLRQIFKNSLAWAKNPLRSHLIDLVDELELSLPFEEAVDNFSKRCSSREIKLLASCLKINHRIGGDLVFVLQNINISLRHSLESRSRAKTLTVQSRYSATIISFFPIAALIVLYFVMNERISAFFSSSLSNVILVAGGCLEIAGIFVMKKIAGAEN